MRVGKRERLARSKQGQKRKITKSIAFCTSHDFEFHVFIISFNSRLHLDTVTISIHQSTSVFHQQPVSQFTSNCIRIHLPIPHWDVIIYSTWPLLLSSQALAGKTNCSDDLQVASRQTQPIPNATDGKDIAVQHERLTVSAQPCGNESV